MEGFNKSKNVDKEEKEPGGVSRRGFIIGGTAAALGYAAAKVEKKVFPTPGDRYEDLQEKLALARNELPEGVPITLSITENGEIIYQHEDQITTEFINYLAGRGELTDEMVAAALRDDMFSFLQGLDIEINTKEARDFLYGINTKAELIKFYVDHFPHFNQDLQEEWKDNPEALAEFRVERARRGQEEMLRQVSPEFYDALWKTYINAGAKSVVIVDTYEERPAYKNHVSGSASSFVFNTENPYMKIDFTGGYKSLLSAFLVESSHMNSYVHNREEFLARFEYQREVLGSLEGLTLEEVLEKRRLAYITEGTAENYDHTIGLEEITRDLSSLNPIVKSILEEEKAKLQSFRNSIE